MPLSSCRAVDVSSARACPTPEPLSAQARRKAKQQQAGQSGHARARSAAPTVAAARARLVNSGLSGDAAVVLVTDVIGRAVVDGRASNATAPRRSVTEVVVARCHVVLGRVRG